MKAMETGTVAGLAALLIALTIAGTHGQQMAQAAQGFAKAGATLIGALQGNSLSAIGA